MPDFLIRNEGSICLLRAVTPGAETWVSEHLPEDAQTFGGQTVIEPRYLSDIIDGILNDGFTVQAS